MPEAKALGADQVLCGDNEILDEELAGVVIHHGVDRPDGDLAVRDRLLQIDDEYREALGLVGEVLIRGRPSQ